MRNPTPNYEGRNEFEWEAAFKKGDKLAHSYFELLTQYGDYPENRSIIESTIDQKYNNLEEFLESDLILAEEEQSFAEQFSEPSEIEIEEEIKAFETSPIYNRLKVTSLGWCNVLTLLLTAENKEYGLKVLYYLGRALATTICAMSSDAEKSGIIAFRKRTLSYLNTCTGLIQKIILNTPNHKNILETVISQVTMIHELTADQLFGDKKNSQ